MKEDPKIGEHGKHVAVALGDSVIENYSTVGVMLIDILMEPLQKFVSSPGSMALRDVSADIVSFSLDWIYP